jgi:hypothetical protein
MTSADGRRLRRIRAAYAAHKVIRASGRRCCEEAARAAAEKRRLDRQRKQWQDLYGCDWRNGHNCLGDV